MDRDIDGQIDRQIYRKDYLRSRENKEKLVNKLEHLTAT